MSKRSQWSREWPKKPGSYWFYGWPYGDTQTIVDKKPVAPELNHVKVIQVSNGIMHVRDGNFWSKSEGGIGLFCEAALPALPPGSLPAVPTGEAMSENLREARIKCAAILFEGKIYEGDAHCDIGLAMVRDGVCKPPYPGGPAQGFVTEKGTFLNRYQALRVAAQAGQVVWGKTLNSEELFSEDLKQGQ